MPFKNLEHDGFEDFKKFSSRDKVQLSQKAKKDKRPKKVDRLKIEQEEYMRTNPDLWEGNPDLDE